MNFSEVNRENSVICYKTLQYNFTWRLKPRLHKPAPVCTGLKFIKVSPMSDCRPVVANGVLNRQILFKHPLRHLIVADSNSYCAS
jgi:hypothetical protein